MDDILSVAATSTTHNFSGPNAEPVTVERASEIVMASARKAIAEDVAFTDALGRVLLESIKADADFPRFDMVAIDGVAVMEQGAMPGARLCIADIQRAGMDRLTLDDPSACLEVMAGAIVPHGASCIIPYADIDIEEGTTRYATVNAMPGKPDAFIHWQGSDRRKGDELIPAGTEVTAAEIAVIASVGKSYIRVARIPRVAVITTGDELVAVSAKPLPYQVRESNSYAISTILKKVGVECDRFHLPDDPQVIASSIAEWTMTYDVLLFSGGVSKGVGDYLPGVLKDVGVQPLFHGVNQRPGRPFWFGIKPDAVRGEMIVFALPGNPVSSFICAYRYCLPWLEVSFGRSSRIAEYARLAEPVSVTGNLTHFVPVKLTVSPDGTILATPQALHGAGDHSALLTADAFVELPKGETEFEAGRSFPILRYR